MPNLKWEPQEQAKMIDCIEAGLSVHQWPDLFPKRTLANLMQRRQFLIKEGYADVPRKV